jgi:hypothetical protein
MPPSSPPPAARWIAVVAVVALTAGLAVAVRQWRASIRAAQPNPAPSEQPVAAALDSVDDQAVEQALRLTPRVADSTKVDKSKWMDEVQGFDVSRLTPRQHEVFVRFANAERCTCGCGYTLAGCRAYDAECEVSLPRVRALYDSVESGLITRATGLRQPPSRHP